MPDFPSTSEPRPTEIMRLPETRQLRVTWKDGHVTLYPYDMLREMCPCAGCGEARRTGGKFEPGPMPAVVPFQPNYLNVVGHYAVQFQWSDGHDTGIYSFRLLRENCPCDVCVAQRARP